MGKRHTPIGPRKKIDIASLRAMPREQRLRLLTQSVTECGGRSEDEWGSYRRILAMAHKSGNSAEQAN